MKMISSEIRKLFLEYFATNDHLVIGSSSLVPANDPTLLIVNSGMAPLKSYFAGEKQPPRPRLCNIQKCIRTNDIESVGDRHHLTFFEMMGNWSIGDYFKEKAIAFAWQLIKDVFGFDTLKIYVTVYGGDKNLPNIPSDNESAKIWENIGLPLNRIIKLGAKSNFWGPAGGKGACGPCTEIFIDRGEEYGCRQAGCGLECECGRFLEIWNAGVFIQYHLHENKTLTELPLKSVDAGAGLERFAVILQKVDSIYETDLLNSITEVFTSGTNFNSKTRSVRIMTDHIRCATFMIADGIYPGNTKKEYILRRILRRALMHANLSETDPIRLVVAADTVVRIFSQYYPEIESSRNVIESVIKQEITIFRKTLDRGLREFNKVISHSREIISGADAFKLHDTYGLPLDLTKELAKEKGLQVDEEGYKSRLEKQRERSRQKGKN